MITEKEIIEIMRNINQYEFTTYLGYYMAVAKAIMDKIKEKSSEDKREKQKEIYNLTGREVDLEDL